MNRLTYAWGVLRHGIPEPELAYIPDGAQVADLFTVHLYDWTFYSHIGPAKTNNRWRYFLTCEQAHAAFPDTPVQRTKAIRAGGRYFFHNRLREIEVQPKPMRAKGVAA